MLILLPVNPVDMPPTDHDYHPTVTSEESPVMNDITPTDVPSSSETVGLSSGLSSGSTSSRKRISYLADVCRARVFSDITPRKRQLLKIPKSRDLKITRLSATLEQIQYIQQRVVRQSGRK
uniref:Uncharacterized protein n=1 Tax=Lygus hesperus TaxID=30085 RepID=A0A146KR64_LYGHE